MEMNEAINKAIEAHGQWFTRLQQAIQNGTSEFKPEIVKTDNNCVFGKWLYGEFPIAMRSLPVYTIIKDLHAQFHQEAAKILDLGLKGKKEEALKLMAAGSPFKMLSGKLVLTLQSLKKK